jgi:hypothetical protein
LRIEDPAKERLSIRRRTSFFILITLGWGFGQQQRKPTLRLD